MLNQLLERSKYRLKQVVEGNVYVQHWAMRLAYHCPFMLPHDADYMGVTGLCLGDPASDGLLDVGANLGLSALSFRKLLPKVRILSLEPNPSHAQWLAKIKRRDANFDFLLVGAGAANDSVVLHIPYYGRVPLHTMASLQLGELQETCRTLYGDKCHDIRIQTTQVTIVPIDQLEISPELIKVDAEGFELEILRGAHETLRRSRPHLLLENNRHSAEAVRQLLAPLGYTCSYWDNVKKDFTVAERHTRNVYFISERGCRARTAA
jgi:FkbM family methyltransferase